MLLRWDPRNLYRRVFADEAERERFLKRPAGDGVHRRNRRRADVSPTPSRREFARFPEFASELRMFDARWMETLGGPIEENVALLRDAAGQRRGAFMR